MKSFVPACVILTAFLAARGDAAEPIVKTARRLARPLVDADRVDGLSVGIISRHRTWTFHLGQVSKNGGEPTDETIYEIGSISKVFTGLLLADAVVRGDAALDQPAGTLLPEGVIMPGENDQPITLASLSTHRSGLPRLPDNINGLQSDNPYSQYDSKLAYAFLNKHQLRRRPGAAAEYSNFAVGLLGHLLCLKAEKTYDELLADRLTGPLGMSDTVVTVSADQKARMATPHLAPGQPFSTWDFADMPGAGGIRSTITDMMTFAGAQLDPPEGKLGEAIELAWTEHQPASGDDFAMGLGWHLARDGATRWHNGQTGGYHSMMLVSRKLDAAVVVLANTASPDVDPLAQDIMRILAGDDVTPREFPKQVVVPMEKMKRLVGKYQLVPGFVFDVNVVEDRLMVGLTGQPTLRVYPKSETQWVYRIVDATLTFTIDEETGKAGSLDLFQNGIHQMARRID